ncbi:MAG: hypothetical protein AAFX45_06770 [Pseudomonadota bacterium]
MRFLWTLSVVPRPDASFLGLMGVTLASFLLFQDVPVAVFGRDLTALQLTLSVFFFTSIARNLILNSSMWRRTTGKIGGLVAMLMVPVAVLWITSVAAPVTLQIAFSAYMLAYAAVVLAMVKWDGDNLHMLPSVWARDPRFAPQTVTLVAVGDAVFAVTLAAIALHGSELAWIVVMTLGAIATKLFVNWINVLMVIVLLEDDD